MRTGDIREKDDKGRHTTTHRQLIEADGVFLVDTPGMREFGICEAEEGLHEVFGILKKKHGNAVSATAPTKRAGLRRAAGD